MNPEEQARQQIDRLLTAAGWAVQDFKAADLTAARGVALREFQLNPSFGEANYLLYVDGRAAGIIEAKRQGATLTGVEVQSSKYAQDTKSGAVQYLTLRARIRVMVGATASLFGAWGRRGRALCMLDEPREPGGVTVRS